MHSVGFLLLVMMNTIFILLCLFTVVHGVPLSEFFPYGPTVNDQVFPTNDDGSTNALPLPQIFPYFNNNHRQIYLANNGLFSFLGPISEFVPTAFPLSDNRRLIAGFWSDIDTRGYIPSGNLVYYHIYGDQNNTEIFEKARRYVQQYFPGERAFSPTMVITGTWYRVGAFNMQTSATNTFQIVLTTDEIRSFAFLLYHDLQWSNPSNSPSQTSGQAGFNAGDGIVFEMLPYSRTDAIRQLVNISNVNVPGLFVFRIDTDTITLGGCGNNSNFLFRPRRGSQLGLTPITFQGPCFTNLTENDVKCRFGESTIVDAIIINEFQAICLTPSVSLPSFTNIDLSIDGGNTYELLPYLFTYTPAEYGLSSIDNAQVMIVNQTDMIITVGGQIELAWYLSETTMITWSNNSMRFEIQMCIATLNESNGGLTENDCQTLQTNLIPVLGYQFASITIPSMGNDSDLSMVFFRIIARNSLTNQIYMGLHSPLFVLHDPTIDTADYCYSWAAVQPSPETWNEGLFPCPLTLAQARVARCCYEPDPLCNVPNSYSPVNCALHRGRSDYDEASAIACYISRSTNQWNAGAECCYDSIGQLITRGTGGGTDDRYRPSAYPVQHFFGDTLPYFACCLLTSNEETCARYFSLRPHRRGSNSPNSWGGTWGDPHFNSLDRSTFTFNGFGEYTYLAITDVPTPINTPFNPSMQTLVFHSQIRTTPLSSLSTSATVIRGFAAKSNESLAERISVTISRREMLIIQRGNETLDLELNNDNTIASNNTLTLFFPEMTLEQNRTSGVLTLSWFIGVSIQITPIAITNGLVLNIGVSVAGSFRNCTFGLLGLYDDNPSNDLRTENGTILDPANTLTLEQIHRQFGQTWAINPSRSLFYYESGDSALFYANQNNAYTPLFTLPNPPSSQVNTILAACNIQSEATDQTAWTISQQTCYYDMAVTNDISLAQASRTAGDTLLQISIDQRYPPEFNTSLPLTLTVNELTPITINFTAVSAYTSNIIYTLVQGPASAAFDNVTAIFNWSNPSVNDTDAVVRVTAQDTVYNLLSTHELIIRIVNHPQPSHGPIISFTWLFILMNIIGTFSFY